MRVIVGDDVDEGAVVNVNNIDAGAGGYNIGARGTIDDVNIDVGPGSHNMCARGTVDDIDAGVPWVLLLLLI